MLTTISNLTLIGAGKMGMALARGWLQGGLPAQSLHLVDPAPHGSVVEFAQARGVSIGPAAPESPAGILVIAVKPQVVDQVFPALRRSVNDETLVLSIAAGISVRRLSEGLGTRRVIRTMPNTPAQVGKGVTGLVRGADVTDADWDIAHALFSASGLVVDLPDEGDIDALTAVSGSGPAYVFHLVEAMAAAGVAEGLSPDAAMVLARQTVIGAAALMEADPTDAATLRQNVTSPNGTTFEALQVLMDPQTGMPALFKKAVHAARVRSEELGK